MLGPVSGRRPVDATAAAVHKPRFACFGPLPIQPGACAGPCRARSTFLCTEGAEARAQRRERALQVPLQPLNTQLQASSHLGGSVPLRRRRRHLSVCAPVRGGQPSLVFQQPLPTLKGWLRGWFAHPLFHSAMARLPANQALPFSPGAPGRLRKRRCAAHHPPASFRARLVGRSLNPGHEPPAALPPPDQRQ